MSLPTLIDLRVCWDQDSKSTVFVNVSLSLINGGEESLLDVIKREVRKKVIDETRMINYEHDIKSVVNDDGKDVSQIIRVPLSHSIIRLSRRKDDDIIITVVLDKPAPAFSAANANAARKIPLPYHVLLCSFCVALVMALGMRRDFHSLSMIMAQTTTSNFHSSGNSTRASNATKRDFYSDSNLAIFYNIYVPLDANETHRKKIMDDMLASQIKLLGGSYAVEAEKNKSKVVKLYYNTIGHPLEHAFMEENCAPFDNLQPIHMKHYARADENVTLHALHEYCKERPANNAIYVHPKGSFHPREGQDEWREEGTKYASSEECTKSIHKGECNACGYRLWVYPPIFAGNFWMAQCSYVRELRRVSEIESLFQESYVTAKSPPTNMTFTLMVDAPMWMGLGRYHQEHWIASHPNLRPCSENFGVKRVDENVTCVHREYFLLPGLLWKWATVYNDTAIPREDSFYWRKFPDGMKYREAVVSLGSIKGGVHQMMGV